ncbi:hypothetical protein FRC02_006281 [Tulasnella sp. 418]|nr:hypothetical protein FRC02_006281 [Tulasnella sp. 418]
MSNFIPDKAGRSTSPRRAPGRHTQKLPRGSACVSCRERKVRCDGNEPVCLVCERAGRTCIYSSTKVAPAPGSTAALDAKLSSLEERMRQLTELNADVDEYDDYDDAEGNFISAHPGPLGFDVEEIPIEACRPFIDIFFEKSLGYLLLVPPERFYDDIHNADPKHQPHPALIYAMTLVGIECSAIRAVVEPGFHPSSAPLKADVVLTLARKHLDASLANADRLLDHLQASILVAFWLLRQGRLQEAQYMTSTNARLTVIYKLHQIDQVAMREYLESTSTSAPSIWDGTLLRKPSSHQELGFRIAVFWQAYYYDKFLSMTTGLLSAYNESSPEEEITTPWLRPMEEYKTGQALHGPYASFGTLTDLNELESTSNHPFTTLVLKAVSMLYRSSNVLVDPLAAEPYPAIDSMRILLAAATKMLDQLPKVQKHSGSRGSSLLQPSEMVITVVECMLLVTVINIHGAAESLPSPHSFWDKEQSQVFRIDAARKVIGRGQLMKDANAPYLSIGFMLTPACKVLAEHSRHIRSVGWDNSTSKGGMAPVALEDIEKELSIGVSLLSDLAELFPVLEVQLEKIRAH